MASTFNSPTGRLLLLVLSIFLLAIGLTFALFLAFLPASLVSTTLFILTLCIEGIGLVFILTSLPLHAGGARVSGASRAIAFGAVPLFALVAILTTMLYGAFRNPAQDCDGRFAIILLAEALVCFVPAVMVMGLDLFRQGQQAPQEEVRLHQAQCSQALTGAIGRLRALKQSDLALMQRSDRLEKSLKALETRLLHSPASDTRANDLEKFVDQVTHLAEHLPTEGRELNSALETMEFAVQRLQQALNDR